MFLSVQTLNVVLKRITDHEFGKENDSINLTEMQLNDPDYLKSWSTEGLTSMSIVGNDDIESLSELRETFKKCPSRQSLTIKNCLRLKCLEATGWQHLTALDSLRLYVLPHLKLSGRTEDDVYYYHHYDNVAADDDMMMRMVVVFFFSVLVR